MGNPAWDAWSSAQTSCWLCVTNNFNGIRVGALPCTELVFVQPCPTVDAFLNPVLEIRRPRRRVVGYITCLLTGLLVISSYLVTNRRPRTPPRVVEQTPTQRDTARGSTRQPDTARHSPAQPDTTRHIRAHPSTSHTQAPETKKRKESQIWSPETQFSPVNDLLGANIGP